MATLAKKIPGPKYPPSRLTRHSAPSADDTATSLRIELRGDIAVIHFQAMASPCEVHLVTRDSKIAESAATLARNEALRIEQKYSRYRTDSIVHQINSANAIAVELDNESLNLFEFAGRCYALSDGMFDITSGILRRAWKFDGHEFEPDHHLIADLLQLIGWEKVRLTRSENAPTGFLESVGSIQMPAGMEIDLGGVGKEYAVDRVAQMLAAEFDLPLLVNFGGDVRVVSSKRIDREWCIGIENPGIETPSDRSAVVGQVTISSGGVATSGDLRRFCICAGRRLSHILNPKTGWPVEGAPRSVTVLGSNCLEAGLFSTLGMLKGAGAELFLGHEGLDFHIVR